MKPILLFVAAVSLSMASCAQDIPASKVPSVVQNTVQAKFATASNIEWEKKNNSYEAEFDMANTEYSVYVSADGKLIVYKLDIPASELPSPVTTAINRDHAGYRIDDADKIEKDGLTYYQVELEAKGKKDKNLVFAADGKLAEKIPYMK